MPAFDSSYGETLDSLLSVTAPPRPADFDSFWRARYERCMQISSLPTLQHSGRRVQEHELFDLSYRSTDNVTIGGWALIPGRHPVQRVIIVGHGYGGASEPTEVLPLAGTAFLFPCFRGLSRSRLPGVPEDPNYHVLYHIDDRHRYVLGGCVDDLWQAISAAQVLFPAARHRIGVMGISFSGGISMLATPWDQRIQRVHVQVPSFGHHPRRLEIPTHGSAHAVQNFYKRHPQILEILMYYDAAVAACSITHPVHVAPALADPVVAPAGQFAIYNSLTCPRQLFVLKHGHEPYAEAEAEQNALKKELSQFFDPL